MVRLAGFEPTTPWFVAKYSIQLSYSRTQKRDYSKGFKKGKRVTAICLIAMIVYPSEAVVCCSLWIIMNKAFVKESSEDNDDDLDVAQPDIPAGTKNYITPAGYRRMRDERLHLIDVERPEVVKLVSWAASKNVVEKTKGLPIGRPLKSGAAGRIRTHDPLVRSQVLYPTELQPHSLRV